MKFKLSKVLPTFSYSTISDALVIAIQAHDGQFDRSGLPYILHPIAVMQKVYDDNRDKYSSDLLSCAILHDVLEDSTIFTREEIEEHVGSVEATIVDTLTHKMGEPYNCYIERIVEFSRKHKNDYYGNYPIIIKRADIWHNTLPHRLASFDEADVNRKLTKYSAALKILDGK